MPRLTIPLVVSMLFINPQGQREKMRSMRGRPPRIAITRTHPGGMRQRSPGVCEVEKINKETDSGQRLGVVGGRQLEHTASELYDISLGWTVPFLCLLSMEILGE